MPSSVTGWTPGPSRIRRFRRRKKQLRKSSHGLVLLFRVHPLVERPRTAPGKPGTAAPPLRFRPLQRVPARAKGIKCPGLPHPERQASSGFPNLVTLRIAPCLLTVFQARSAHGVSPSELSSSRAAVHRFQCRYPHVVGQPPEKRHRPPTPSQEQAPRQRK
jgi:hypothetical protein